ncbi:MAG: radical SAM protein [Butyrivibrio sp.]|nr:radical SAM protein [Butyrivibrio sp.]
MVKRLICINVPIRVCNLKCGYCYLSQTGKWDLERKVFQYDTDHMVKAFSVERFGGECLINITGVGETLMAPGIVEFIHGLLKQGHYIELVTNGTLSIRFQELSKIPARLLSKVMIKYSFHYRELTRLGLLDSFFENVKLMSKAGCSYTVEMVPEDELIPEIEEIKALCIKKLGAPCHLTIGRNDKKRGKDILSRLNDSEYYKTWSTFDSSMFSYKWKLLGNKRREFCYAGAWSLYVNLATGDAKSCYGQPVSQNIFKDLTEPVKFVPVGHYCTLPYCQNGHAFLTMGMIPGLEAPSYYDMRNRVRDDGTCWLSDDIKEAYTTKLYKCNVEYSVIRRAMHTVFYPFYAVFSWMRNS